MLQEGGREGGKEGRKGKRAYLKIADRRKSRKEKDTDTGTTDDPARRESLRVAAEEAAACVGG